VSRNHTGDAEEGKGKGLPESSQDGEESKRASTGSGKEVYSREIGGGPQNIQLRRRETQQKKRAVGGRVGVGGQSTKKGRFTVLKEEGGISERVRPVKKRE